MLMCPDVGGEGVQLISVFNDKHSLGGSHFEWLKKLCVNDQSLRRYGCYKPAVNTGAWPFPTL